MEKQYNLESIPQIVGENSTDDKGKYKGQISHLLYHSIIIF